MNKKSLVGGKSPLINLLIDFISIFADDEQELITRKGIFSLIFSRILSIFGVLFLVFALTFSTFYIVMFIGNAYFSHIYESNTEYWWTIPLVIGTPFLVKILLNFNNREYIFCERVKSFLEVLNYSTLKIGYFRAIAEILFALLFILFYFMAVF